MIKTEIDEDEINDGIYKVFKEKCDKFHDIFSQKKIKEDDFLALLTTTDNFQRQVIAGIYQQKYRCSIHDEIKSKFSSDARDIISKLFYNPYEFDCRELNKALHSFSTDESVINEIIVTRPFWWIQIMDREYIKLYKISIKDDISKQTSGEYKKFLICLIENQRNEGQTLNSSSKLDAELNKIYTNKLKNYGKNVDLFRELFALMSRQDLVLISRIYYMKDKKKRDFYEAINDEIGGKTGDLIKTILFSTITPSQYFAKQILKSIDRIGTDDSTLMRVLISRCEIDMGYIREYYKIVKDKNDADMIKDIEDDTSGIYGKICVFLAKLNGEIAK